LSCSSRFLANWKVRSAQLRQIELLLQVLHKLEGQISTAEMEQEKNFWLVVNIYITVCYVVSLCGAKRLLLDLSGLNGKWGLGAKNTL
jgi:hypothetical protein